MFELTGNIELDLPLYVFYNKFKDTALKSAALMKSRYMMKKNAYQYSNRSEFDEGSIDCEKLYSYKTNHDIFSKIQTVRRGKSHGIVIFVDCSISMGSILPEICEQLLTTVFFCQMVNIPFEVYLTGSVKIPEFNSDSSKFPTLELADKNFKLLFSSRDSKEVLNNSMQAFFHYSIFYSQVVTAGIVMLRDQGLSYKETIEHVKNVVEHQSTKRYAFEHIVIFFAMSIYASKNFRYNIFKKHQIDLSRVFLNSHFIAYYGSEKYDSIGQQAYKKLSADKILFIENTPMFDWMLGAIPFVKKFKAKNNLQNTATLFMSDGEVNCYPTGDQPSSIFMIMPQTKNINLAVNGTSYSDKHFGTPKISKDLSLNNAIQLLNYNFHAGLFKSQTGSNLGLMSVCNRLKNSIFYSDAVKKNDAYIGIINKYNFDLISVSLGDIRFSFFENEEKKHIDKLVNKKIKAKRNFELELKKIALQNVMCYDIVNLLCKDFILERKVR